MVRDLASLQWSRVTDRTALPNLLLHRPTNRRVVLLLVLVVEDSVVVQNVLCLLTSTFPVVLDRLDPLANYLPVVLQLSVVVFTMPWLSPVTLITVLLV